MIQLEGVSRWYGEVIGVNDVTCEIKPGLTALLGMNGAGKSTLMRLVTGQLRPTTGYVKVLGMDPFANSEVFKRLGYCPEIDNFYEHRSGRQFVYFLARLNGFSHSEAADRTQKMLEMVGMVKFADRPIAGYSKGMRQRIKLAQAMLNDPDVLLLDEPLNGLDPVGRHELIQLLGQLAASGKVVLVSSHILYEVQAMTESLILLHRGRLLATGGLRVIRSLIDKHPHKIRLQSPDPRLVAKHMASLPNVVSLRFNRIDDSLDLEVQDPATFYDSLSDLVLRENLKLTSFSSPDNNLESVFQYLIHS